MILSAASAPVAAHSLTYTLVTLSVVTTIVALAVLVILFCVWLSFKIYTEEQRTERERREDQAKAEARNHKLITHHKK